MTEKVLKLPKTIRGVSPDYKNQRREKIDAELAIAGIYSGVSMSHYTPTMTESGGETVAPDPVELFVAMEKIADKVVDGNNMEDIERMLVNQSLVLNAVFNQMLMLAGTATQLNHRELCLKSAFRAQAQSRCTAETLSNIKNPRQVAFVRQANINHGNQQVNNNGQETTTTRTRESFSESAPNELLEDNYGNHLDTGAQGAAIGADPQLATLGKIDRRDNTRGQRAVGKKRLEGRQPTPDA